LPEALSREVPDVHVVDEVGVAVDVVELKVRQAVGRAIGGQIGDADFVIAIEAGCAIIIRLCGTGVRNTCGTVHNVDRGSAAAGAVAGLGAGRVIRIAEGLIVVVKAELFATLHPTGAGQLTHAQPQRVCINEPVDELTGVGVGRARG